MCQRPKRAFFISTKWIALVPVAVVCQRPKRAFFISTIYEEFQLENGKAVSTP